MCGIAGVFEIGKFSNKSSTLKLMLDKLSHRGPDSEGVWQEGPIVLGHRRLSIIDLSETANQPMIDSTGNYVIVYNGELYNYKDIKESLKGEYEFKTNSDTEVILAAFLKWGKKCLDLFNGIFAFAIWDRSREELFLARDQVGVKPLFFYRDKDVFLFSSELASIIKSNAFKASVNLQGLKDFLKYQSVHEPNTMVSGVYQIRAGYSMTITKKGASLENYWNITDLPFKSSLKSYLDTTKEVKIALNKAIERQLVSDVPLSIFLSGGIDSSIVAGIASNLSSQPINTFSIGFDDKKFDESKYANLVAKDIKSNHTSLIVKPDNFMDYLPESLRSLSSPSGDGPNTYLISKLVTNTGIKVALSGLGGDELFAGYPHFTKYEQVNKLRDKVPLWISQSVGNLLTTIPSEKLNKVGRILSMQSNNLWDYYPISREIYTDNELKRLNPLFEYTYDTVFESLFQNREEIVRFEKYSQYSIGELLNYTKNVLLEDADQMSMANGLELRVPLLDIDLITLCLTIPDEFKNPHGYKKLLVDSSDYKLPYELVHRKKMGFSFPWEKWMRTELFSFCDGNMKNLSHREYFDRTEILKMWNLFLTKDPKVSWVNIWLLVVFECWLLNNEIN
jgi:asparagine synthase (glutamine-hydrolysing)